MRRQSEAGHQGRWCGDEEAHDIDDGCKGSLSELTEAKESV